MLGSLKGWGYFGNKCLGVLCVVIRGGEDESFIIFLASRRFWIGSLEEINIGKSEGFRRAWAPTSRRGSSELVISANRGGVHRGAWASKGVSLFPC